MGLSDPNLGEESEGDEDDFEESMSMYEEDEEDLNPDVSFDEDIEDLQSYRNNNLGIYNDGG